MTDLAERHMTLAEFLDWDDGTDTRYELIDGRPVAMAPVGGGHSIVINVAVALRQRLKPPCIVGGEAGVLAPDAGNTYFKADLIVSCSPHQRGQRLLVDPVVVVEVSPSTEDHDRGRKLYAYRHIESVQEILLVASEQRHVEHWRRMGAKWEVEDLIGEAVVTLPGLGIELPLAEVYVGSGI
jgi:Uma2 family endonuclease